MRQRGDASDDSAKTVPRPPERRSPIRGKTFMGMAGLAVGNAPTMLSQPLVEGGGTGQREDARISKTEDHYYDPIVELGRGGMGIVYKATQVMKLRGSERGVKRTVALKVINFDSEYTKEKIKELIERFITEAELVTKLDHKNVIKLLDFGQTDDGKLYYAMEFLEGQDLDALLWKRGGSLPWQAAKPIIEQVCSALDAAHNYKDKESGERKPIIHRDIKPANIFLTTDEDGNQLVKVLDFGLAKIQTPIGHEITQVGEGGMGTPEYMSPEQATPPYVVDHRTDIYAVGAVLYHMLTGREPLIIERVQRMEAEAPEQFRQREIDACVKNQRVIRTEQPQPLRTVAPGLDIPAELENIVLKCLEKDAKKRYQTVRELKRALESCNGAKKSNGRTTNGDGPESEPPAIQTAIINGEEPVGPAGPGGPYCSSRLPVQNGANGQQASDGAIVMQAGTRADGEKKVPARRKFSRWFIIGAAAITCLGGAATGVIAVSGSGTGQRQDVQETAEPPQNRTPVKRLPLAELPRAAGTAQAADGAGTKQPPEAAAAPQRDAAPAEVAETHAVTISAGVAGVDVLLSGETACKTAGNGTCSLTVAAGSGPVELTFRKRGYREARRSITPDRDQSVEVAMERAPARNRPGQPRPGTARITDQGDNSRVVIPPE
jgi:serine/threonine protein kinase